MEENHDQSYNFFSLFSPRFLLVVFVIVVTLIFVSGAVFGAENETKPRLDRSELQAQDRHTSLMVTAAQEERMGQSMTSSPTARLRVPTHGRNQEADAGVCESVRRHSAACVLRAAAIAGHQPFLPAGTASPLEPGPAMRSSPFVNAGM